MKRKSEDSLAYTLFLKAPGVFVFFGIFNVLAQFFVSKIGVGGVAGAWVGFVVYGLGLMATGYMVLESINRTNHWWLKYLAYVVVGLEFILLAGSFYIVVTSTLAHFQ